jgi:hypothetical protein
MRHGYYLKRRHFAYSGTRESTKEKEWSKMDTKNWEMTVPSPGIPVQPVNYRSTTGPPV